ncbi:MAG: hypothetical protein KAJ90_03935 [Desulfobacterales bacterium]|nr:hypothetical protein [Desulfobacterales bacterium]
MRVCRLLLNAGVDLAQAEVYREKLAEVRACLDTGIETDSPSWWRLSAR